MKNASRKWLAENGLLILPYAIFELHFALAEHNIFVYVVLRILYQPIDCL